MAKELGQYNIRVNAVLPGFVDTPMNDFITPEERIKLNEMTPLGRMAIATDIANVILFLGSDLASFCSASLFDCNGGATL